MKKVFFMLLAGLMCFAISSCDKCKKGDKEVKSDFITGLEDEYNSLVDKYPGIVFYTSMIELDTTVKSKDELVICNFTNVYQNGDTAIVITHEGDKVTIDYVADHWMEDVKIDPNTLVLSLETAWSRLWASEIVKPNPIHKVCLRNPLGPTIGNPMYIFGQGMYFVAVDAMTGDVKEIYRDGAKFGKDIKK